MMRLDIHVARSVHGKVKEAVTPEGVEHVIEERHASVDIGNPRAIEVKSYRDVRLARRTRNFGATSHM